MARKKIAVLDIGSKEIRLFVLKSKSNRGFDVLTQVETAYSGFSEGEFFEPFKLNQVISETILKAQKQSKFYFKELYVGLGGEFLLVKTKEMQKNYNQRRKISQIDLDFIYDEEDPLKNNANYILIGCNPLNFLLDNEKVTTSPLNQKLFSLKANLSYVYANKNVIEKLNEVFKEIGLHAVSYLSSPYAQFRYLLDENVRKDNTVIVDIGYISSHIVIGRYDGVSYLNSFNIGGGHIMGDLAQIIKIDLEQAEHLKRNAILTLSDDSVGGYEVFLKGQFYEVPAKIVSDIIKARISQVADLIKAVLKKSEIEYPDYLPLFLTGGGISMIKGAKEFLQNHLKRPVEILDVEHISFAKPNLVPLWALCKLCMEKEWEISRGFLAKLFKKW